MSSFISIQRRSLPVADSNSIGLANLARCLVHEIFATPCFTECGKSHQHRGSVRRSGIMNFLNFISPI